MSAPGGVGIPACTEADTPPGETATAAHGMHPTGMHSFLMFNQNWRRLNLTLGRIICVSCGKKIPKNKVKKLPSNQ